MNLLTAMQSSDRANLERLEILIVDDNNQALDILTQVMIGFGARKLHKCSNGEEAKLILSKMPIDLVITDASMPVIDGYSLVHWLRREGASSNKYIPTVVVTGHTRESEVIKARDCGANFTIAKPITPGIVLQRIFWCAKEERMFVQSPSYVGPDRRFKRMGPPDGVKGRRADDLSASVGEAVAPNLSQDQIDGMMKPQKAAL